MGILENRADANRVLLQTVLAFINALADRPLGIVPWFKLVRAVTTAAMRANRAFRPKLAFKELAGRIFIGEKAGKGCQVKLLVVRRFLLNVVHQENCTSESLVCQV
jgi:hypothetical protein